MQANNPPEKISFQQKINSLQYKQQIEEFNKNLQRGDLGLSQTINYGFILAGDTRAGKTALGHVLSGNTLKGTKINGQSMLIPNTSKNTKAAIGNSMNSQTLVPNIFSVQIKKRNEKFNLVDTPGYGDTKGILTIFANSYYHFRVYSKVVNMKFILCFDMIQLQNTCTDFLKTLFNWSNSFKNYIKVRKQIWKSVAFVITKVEDKPSIKQDLKTKLKSIAKDMSTLYEKDFQESIKQLIDFIIEEDRLFFVKKIKDGQTLVCGDLLETIDKKVTHWWSRNYDPVKKQVDMEPVAFALTQQILKSTTQYPKCRGQFAELITYYNTRIKQFIRQPYSTLSDGQNYSLAFVIQKLIDDAMDHPDSHKFIDVMRNYINMYYFKYDNYYKEERQKLEKKLFSIDDEQSLTQRSRGQFRGKDKNYLVKKFRCLQEIQILKSEINSIVLDETGVQSVKSIEVCATNLYEIIKEFNRIAFKRNLASEVIYKYGYVIHRIIEEAKIFTLLLESSEAIDKASLEKENQSKNTGHMMKEPSDKQKILALTNGQLITLLRQLIDFMGVSFKYNKKEVTYDQLHLAFINKFDFSEKQYKSLLINEDLVSFFTHVDIHDQKDMDKQIQVVLQYSDNVLEEAEKLSTLIFDKQKGKLIRRLTNIRINYQPFYQLKTKPDQKNYVLFTIRKATKNLGKLLQLFGEYKLSRQVYSTIGFVDSVCKMYRSEINLLKKANLKSQQTRTKQFDLRIQYSLYLAQHFREHEAFEVLQQSFELAEDTVELKKVKGYLSELRLKMKEAAVGDYHQKLFSEDDFDNFNEKLSKKLEDFSYKAAV